MNCGPNKRETEREGSEWNREINRKCRCMHRMKERRKIPNNINCIWFRIINQPTFQCVCVRLWIHYYAFKWTDFCFALHIFNTVNGIILHWIVELAHIIWWDTSLRIAYDKFLVGFGSLSLATTLTLFCIQ